MMMQFQAILLLILAKYTVSYFLCQCTISGDGNELCCRLFGLCCEGGNLDVPEIYEPTAVPSVKSSTLADNPVIFYEQPNYKGNPKMKEVVAQSNSRNQFYDEQNKILPFGSNINLNTSYPAVDGVSLPWPELKNCSCFLESKSQSLEQPRKIDILNLSQQLLPNVFSVYQDSRVAKAYKNLLHTILSKVIMKR